MIQVEITADIHAITEVEKGQWFPFHIQAVTEFHIVKGRRDHIGVEIAARLGQSVGA